ncbi:MAG: hypothetical protein IPM46_14355 [Flavobacteriales bacterium]|nr:hypothetical protein [Flavobacteriales bacterium]
MKKVYYDVNLEHTRVTPVALVDKGRTNVTMLTGNAAFGTPNPSLATFTAAVDRLDAAG